MARSMVVGLDVYALREFITFVAGFSASHMTAFCAACGAYTGVKFLSPTPIVWLTSSYALRASTKEEERSVLQEGEDNR